MHYWKHQVFQAMVSDPFPKPHPQIEVDYKPDITFLGFLIVEVVSEWSRICWQIGLSV